VSAALLTIDQPLRLHARKKRCRVAVFRNAYKVLIDQEVEAASPTAGAKFRPGACSYNQRSSHPTPVFGTFRVVESDFAGSSLHNAGHARVSSAIQGVRPVSCWLTGLASTDVRPVHTTVKCCVGWICASAISWGNARGVSQKSVHTVLRRSFCRLPIDRYDPVSDKRPQCGSVVNEISLPSASDWERLMVDENREPAHSPRLSSRAAPADRREQVNCQPYPRHQELSGMVARESMKIPGATGGKRGIASKTAKPANAPSLRKGGYAGRRCQLQWRETTGENGVRA
jgi:hypothetical protein